MLILSMKGAGTVGLGTLCSVGFSWWVWFLLEAAIFFFVMIIAKGFPACERQGSNIGKILPPTGNGQ